MTPARRAALKKAQLISARKRNRAKKRQKVGKAVVNLGGMFIAAHASRYVVNPRSAVKDYRDLKAFGQKVFKKKTPAPPTVSKNVQATMTWIPR